MLRNTPPMHCFPAFFRPSLLRRPEFETRLWTTPALAFGNSSRRKAMNY